MRTYSLLFLLVCLVGCADSQPVTQEAALEDGVYEVLAVERDRASLPKPDADARILVFDRQFIKGAEDMPPAYLLLRVSGHAPLDLAKPPTQGEANGRAMLLLNLKPEAAKTLQTLTSKAERAAVVVGGQVVTVHRIRVPIEGGGLQVSC